MLNSISRLGETRPQQEWSNGTEFSGYFDFTEVNLGQPREVAPKFRIEIPENVCFIRSPTLNFRIFWSNGKRPSSRTILCIVREVCYRLRSTCLFQRSPPILKE